MNIELSAQTKQQIQALLAGGAYVSADEVVSAGVALLDLKSNVQQGIDDVAAGRTTSFENDQQLHDYFDDVKQRGRGRLAKDQAAE